MKDEIIAFLENKLKYFHDEYLGFAESGEFSDSQIVRTLNAYRAIHQLVSEVSETENFSDESYKQFINEKLDTVREKISELEKSGNNLRNIIISAADIEDDEKYFEKVMSARHERRKINTERENLIETVKILESVITVMPDSDAGQENSIEVYIKSISGLYSAAGIYKDGRITVLPDSRINPRAYSFSLTGRNFELRRDVNYVQNHVVTQKIEFSSPDEAAAFVTGRSANGGYEWKLNDGTPLETYINQ